MRDALVLFDDRVARDWRPFTLTRPAAELVYGTTTLRHRVERAFHLSCAGHVSAPGLAGYQEPWAPPVLDPGVLPRDRRLVLLSSRFVPDPATALPESPALLRFGDRVVGAVLGPETSAPDPAFFQQPDEYPPDLPAHELAGELLEHVWQLVLGNAQRLAGDLRDAPPSGTVPDGVHRIGEGPLSIGRDVAIEPGVVLDTRSGPIRIEDGAELRASTRLAGPAWIGPRAVLLGGPYQALSVGPVCKVRGEIEEAVILGYSNKAHDGFLGHAYVGMWVNLGAQTTNSDLKNNYGTVRLWTPSGEVDTGARKIGCFLGDHVKTAIGTLLNTGTVVEAGANIFGGMPPKYVPPFSWGGPGAVYDVDRFLDTAATVMQRRDVDLSDSQRALLRTAWQATRGEPTITPHAG